MTQDNLRERGIKTLLVICPICKDKWEEIPDYPSKCISCQVSGVDWTTYDKTRRMAEIDLMPLKILINYLQLLEREQLKRKNFHAASFLNVRSHILASALDCNVLTDIPEPGDTDGAIEPDMSSVRETLYTPTL